jgi:hypothetical protein
MFPSSSAFPYRLRGTKKTKWTTEEDEQLRDAVQKHGTDSWTRISLEIPNRTGKQCRERWIGQLSPTVSKELWSADEDALLIQQQAISGNRWTEIAARMPGRNSLHIKNRWNWLVRHQTSIEEKTLQDYQTLDVVEKMSQKQTIFEPIVINDGIFGVRFEAFQATMLGR